MYFLRLGPFLTAAAVLPAIGLLIYIYRQDRLDKEPFGLLLSLVVLGIVATIGAGIAEQIGSRILKLFFRQSGRLYNFLMYFGIVACSEEGAKLLLLRRRTWNNPNFDYSFDAIVYSVCVSLGFALWENIGYVAMHGFGTAVLRAVTAVPGHACFGVLMGAWYSASKEHEFYNRTGEYRKARRLTFWVPVAAHGLYDYIAVTNSGRGDLRLVFFLLVLFGVSFSLVRRLSREDHPLRHDSFWSNL